MRTSTINGVKKKSGRHLGLDMKVLKPHIELTRYVYVLLWAIDKVYISYLFWLNLQMLLYYRIDLLQWNWHNCCSFWQAFFQRWDFPIELVWLLFMPLRESVSSSHIKFRGKLNTIFVISVVFKLLNDRKASKKYCCQFCSVSVWYFFCHAWHSAGHLGVCMFSGKLMSG